MTRFDEWPADGNDLTVRLASRFSDNAWLVWEVRRVTVTKLESLALALQLEREAFERFKAEQRRGTWDAG